MTRGKRRAERAYLLHVGDALDVYGTWPAPAAIVSDGGYGVRGFPGDPPTPDGLPEWYAEHIAAWSKAARPSTTLWFWNTEIGWATVHPLLATNGWRYEQTVVWDKGLSHIAGNVNGQTLRRFPVVTEVCVLYSRELMIETLEGSMPVKRWLRYEWERAGLAHYRANEACGVKNAATRKYLTQCHLWYFPPPEMMERLVAYANKHGRRDGRPYYSMDGVKPVTRDEWMKLRYRWNNGWHGITNVWTKGQLNGEERFRREAGKRSIHLNQKPLEFMERLIRATTDPGDVVWEPFGGLCSASVAAVALGRKAYTAEPIPEFAEVARRRLREARRKRDAVFHS